MVKRVIQISSVIEVGGTERRKKGHKNCLKSKNKNRYESEMLSLAIEKNEAVRRNIQNTLNQ